MKKETITPEQWFVMSEDERRLVYSNWDIYKGEGAKILKAVLDRFKKDYAAKNAILNIHSGLYHGGDWVIGVTIRWDYKDKIKLPKSYYGFTIQTLYDKLPKNELIDMAKKQFKIWYKGTKRNKEFQETIEQDDFLKSMPQEKLYEYFWLMNGMSKYYNPFEKRRKISRAK